MTEIKVEHKLGNGHWVRSMEGEADMTLATGSLLALARYLRVPLLGMAVVVPGVSAYAASGVIEIEPYKIGQAFAAAEAPDTVTIENVGIVEQETRVRLSPYECATDSEHVGVCYRREVLAHVPVVKVLVSYGRSSGASPEANPWVDEFRLPVEAWRADSKVVFSREAHPGTGHSEIFESCGGDVDHPDCDLVAARREPVTVPMVRVRAAVR